jgi:hypothetical protein
MGFAKTKPGPVPEGESTCLQLFLMVSPVFMAQNDPFKDKRLELLDGKYYIVNRLSATAEPKKKLASGYFDFVIPGTDMKIVYCRHSLAHWQVTQNPKAQTIATDRGHSSIVPRENDKDAERCVFFAGELYFEKEGELKYWTDKSGHYLCTKQQGLGNNPQKVKAIAARQTKYAVDGDNHPLLPMTLFQPWNGEI